MVPVSFHPSIQATTASFHVCKMAMLRARQPDNSCSSASKRKRIFPSPKVPDLPWHPLISYSMHLRYLHQGTKRPRSEASHSLNLKHKLRINGAIRPFLNRFKQHNNVTNKIVYHIPRKHTGISAMFNEVWNLED
jgi:hypothetical protein